MDYVQLLVHTLCVFKLKLAHTLCTNNQIINVNVFDDVFQNAKHRAYDASNDVNCPPLSVQQALHPVPKVPYSYLLNVLLQSPPQYEIQRLHSPGAPGGPEAPGAPDHEL